MYIKAAELLRRAVRASAEALYWVTVGPFVEMSKIISGR